MSKELVKGELDCFFLGAKIMTLIGAIAAATSFDLKYNVFMKIPHYAQAEKLP